MAMRLGSLGKILAGLDAFFDGAKELGFFEPKASQKMVTLERLDQPDAEPTRAPMRVGKKDIIHVSRSHGGSIESRLKKIIRLVRMGKRHPKIQKTVAQILSRKCGGTWCIREKDYKNEIKALFQYVRDNVRYVADPRQVDTFRAPWVTLDWHIADCDDFSSLLASMLEVAGYATKLRVVSIKPRPSGQWTHILVMVSLSPRDLNRFAPLVYVPIDASIDKRPGWYPTSMISGHRDFEVPP